MSVFLDSEIVFHVTLADTDRASDLLIEYGDLSARDPVHVAVMVNRGVERIATFDGGFEVVPGVKRVPLE